MSKFKQITFNSSVGEFSVFLARVKELTKISDVCKLRMYPNREVMFYTIIAEARKVSKMKVSFLDVNELFKNFPYELQEMTYIIADAPKWIKQFSFLTPSKEKEDKVLEVTLMYAPESGEIIKFIASNGELELHSVGGDNSIVTDKLISNSPISSIKQKLDASNGLWKIAISETQLSNMKKLCKIETDTLVTATVENNVVKIYQRLWNQSFVLNDNVQNGIWHFDRSNLEAITQPTKNTDIILSVSSTYMIAHEAQSDFLFPLELHD